MDGFEDVKLLWKGEEYTIPANKVFQLIRKLESILQEETNNPAFLRLMAKQVSLPALCAGYAYAIRFGGGHVTDDQVYLSVMADFAAGTPAGAIFLQDATIGLLMVIAPPFAKQITDGEPGK